MGKGAANKQSATMNQMNQMAQEQFDYYQIEQGKQQIRTDEQREQYEAFEFFNPYVDARNPFAGTQTSFRNIYAGAENQFADLENLYEGMENVYEDMTIDTRAADFQAQQTRQQQANIMQGLRGAAGTSGIAGLAQAMAQQGALQTQQISAGISQQERQNQMMARQGAMQVSQLQRGAGMQLQQLEATGAMQTQQMQMAGAAQARQLGVSQQNIQAQGQWQADMARMQGEAAVQAAEFGRESTLLGAEYGQLAGANQAMSQAMANQMSGMGMQAGMYGAQAQSSASIVGDVVKTGATLAKIYYFCIPKETKIDCVDGNIPIEDIKPGDYVIGYNGHPVKVLQKHEYLEDSEIKRFCKVKLQGEDRVHEVNVCDMHKIKGVASKDITENIISKEIYSGVEFSYDLLTEDLGYRIDGIPVNSMIEEMAELTAKLKNK